MADRIKLVVLADAEEAFALLDEVSDYEAGDSGAGVFGDNGGDPDGDAWIQDARALKDTEIKVLVSAGLAQVVEGWYEKGYDGSDAARDRMAEHADEWCGYSGNRELYYIANDPAPVLVEDDEA